MIRRAIVSTALAAAALGQAQAFTVASVSSTGSINNSLSLLTDGNFAINSWWTAPSNVFWNNQTGPSGAVITVDFGALYTLTDMAWGVDHNDLYQVQVSTNNTSWNSLFVSLPSYLDSGFEGTPPSIIRKTSAPGTGYASFADFPAVQARYARIFAVGGDGAYAVSELQFTGTPVAAVPEPETYALMAAGLLAVGFAARRRAR